MTSLIGQSLGRYHILEQLGEGGMAVVYKAYDSQSECYVAIKVIRTELFGAAILERILQRFTREAKALSKLTHANIVHVYEYGDHQGVPYLVMQYVPSGTLKQWLGKPMPYQQAARLLIPVAEALANAHQHGIVHRDIKPSNILIGETGEPILSDFGIAKLLEVSETVTLTNTGVGIGTPEYMAPEQGMGQEVDARSDIYALGVVFYELITGRKPYTADTPMAVIFKQMTEPLPNPRQYVPELPESVDKVLIKAVSKNPADRYENMGEFCKGLESLGVFSAPYPEPKQASVAGHVETRELVTVDTQATNIQPATQTSETMDELRTVTMSPTRPEIIFPKPKAGNTGKKSSLGWAWALAGGGLGFGIIAVAIIIILVVVIAGTRSTSSPIYTASESYSPPSDAKSYSPPISNSSSSQSETIPDVEKGNTASEPYSPPSDAGSYSPPSSSTSSSSPSVSILDTDQGNFIWIRQASRGLDYKIGPVSDGNYAIAPCKKFLIYASKTGEVFLVKIGESELIILGTVYEFTAIQEGYNWNPTIIDFTDRRVTISDRESGNQKTFRLAASLCE